MIELFRLNYERLAGARARQAERTGPQAAASVPAEGTESTKNRGYRPPDNRYPDSQGRSAYSTAVSIFFRNPAPRMLVVTSSPRLFSALARVRPLYDVEPVSDLEDEGVQPFPVGCQRGERTINEQRSESMD